jgi:hypothetical protein
MGNVISTEAANSLTVRCAVERLLYFAVVVVLAVVLLFAIVVVLAVVLLVVIPEGDLLLFLPLFVLPSCEDPGTAHRPIPLALSPHVRRCGCR